MFMGIDLLLSHHQVLANSRNSIFEKLTEKYPFIIFCLNANKENLGVLQNRDDIVTTR